MSNDWFYPLNNERMPFNRPFYALVPQPRSHKTTFASDTHFFGDTVSLQSWEIFVNYVLQPRWPKCIFKGFIK